MLSARAEEGTTAVQGNPGEIQTQKIQHESLNDMAAGSCRRRIVPEMISASEKKRAGRNVGTPSPDSETVAKARRHLPKCVLALVVNGDVEAGRIKAYALTLARVCRREGQTKMALQLENAAHHMDLGKPLASSIPASG